MNSNQALGWRKSSYSISGNCVEVAVVNEGFVLSRDSKDVQDFLSFQVSEWREFISCICD